MSGVVFSQVLSRSRDLELACRASLLRERQLEESVERLRIGYQHSVARSVDLRRSYRHLQRSALVLLVGVAQTVEAREPYTQGHGMRVGALAQRLALAAGHNRALAEAVARAGQLHDLGKIGLPEALLGKAGSFAEPEVADMRRHAVIGAQLIASLEPLAVVAVIVRHHHERYDGAGYPDGLAGEAIPLGARIVAVADRYDALMSPRPDRPALPPDAARSRLAAEAGRALDPGLTQVLLDRVAVACADADG